MTPNKREGTMSKAGQYIGADGRTYRWEITDGKHIHKRQDAGSVRWYEAYIEDWPAAKAALDALLAEEEGQWVEIDLDHLHNGSARIRPDGTEPQFLSDGRFGTEPGWQPENGYGWPRAYRAGLRVGREEASDDIATLNRNHDSSARLLIEMHEREMKQARELAEAVEAMPETTARSESHSPQTWTISGYQLEPFQEWLCRVVNLAKAVRS